MKLLLDQNLSYKLCAQLADVFPDSAQVRLLGMAESTDRAIWDYARLHGLAIVTMDADFANLAALHGFPPKVIWLRCGNRPSHYVESLLRKNAQRIADFGADEQLSCLELY